MAKSVHLWYLGAMSVLVVLAISKTVSGNKPRDLYLHQYIPFPRLRLIKQQREFSSSQCGIPLELECSSLLGPDCFSRGRSSPIKAIWPVHWVPRSFKSYSCAQITKTATIFSKFIPGVPEKPASAEHTQGLPARDAAAKVRHITNAWS